MTLLPLLVLAALGEPAPRAHVVIVATNVAPGESLPRLRYADDDGARYYELFQALGAEEVTLLTVLDEETQRRFPRVAAAARPPTRAALQQALTEQFDAIRAEQARGERTSFYFVYVGHGAVSEAGDGAMFLSDGRLTRSDLFQLVISRSPATVGHLIIDACNAYLMVARRGAGADRSAIDQAVSQFVGRESLDRHPNFGVIASTSGAAEVHEWERYEAGVFSHEVRSGLAGAADVDHDGAVSYAELRAFVAAANVKVSDPQARVSAHITAPQINLAEPVVDRRWAPQSPTVHVPARLAGRWHLEDERGVRYADFHSAGDSELTLTLVPSPEYYLRDDQQELLIDLRASLHVDAGTLTPHRMTVASRGHEAATFQRDLFAAPFGRAYFEGFLAAPQPEPTLVADGSPGWSPARVAAVGTAGAAVVAVAMSVGLGVRAQDLAEEYRATPGTGPSVEALKGESEDAATAANVLLAVGIGAVVGSVALWLWAD